MLNSKSWNTSKKSETTAPAKSEKKDDGKTKSGTGDRKSTGREENHWQQEQLI